MKQIITNSMFKSAFYNAGRNDNFSYKGLNILFDYFEQLEEDCGIEIELDVIAICCEYQELCVADIVKNYSIDLEDNQDNEEICQIIEDYLQENTQVCGQWCEDDGTVYFVFASF